MNREWNYVINSFMVVGAKNYKKAVRLAMYTYAQLLERAGQPFFDQQKEILETPNGDLSNKFGLWKSQGGFQKGATLTLDQLLVLMTGKINDFDYSIQSVYRRGTPQYMTLFPQGHKPFGTGEKDSRINAVKTLGITLEAYAPLSATKILVDAYWNQLNTARTNQEGQIGNTNTGSDNVQIAAETAMTALYKILGNCMSEYAADPHQITPLFDLQTLRDHSQTVFTGTLDGNEDESVFEHTMLADDELKLQSTTAEAVGFYFSHTGVPGVEDSTLITVAGNSELIVNRSDFGTLANHYLHALNPTAVEGHYRVSIL